MSPRSHDDAFSWEGDDDPTLQVDQPSEPEPAAEPVHAAEPEPAVDAAPPALPDGFTAVGKGSDGVGRIEADGTVVMPGERAPLSDAALLGLGVLGGVYLLYVVGWIIGGLRLQGTAEFLVSPVAYQFALWLAVVAAPLWFGVAYLLTRDAKAWIRFAWLVGGALLLVPWPFIMTGAVGQ